MSKTIKYIITLVVICFFVAVVVFISDLFVKAEFVEEHEFIIEKGESVSEIAQNLYNQDLIHSPLSFKLYVYLRGWQSSLQAGSYIITPMNMAELVKTLVAGKVDNELKLKFIEGWTLEDMADYLVEQKLVTKAADFINLAKKSNFQESFSFLENSRDESLEGFLFPDTYLVYKDSTAVDVIEKMLDNFNKKLTPALKTEITAQGKNLYDVLIMASIIEQEVRQDEDRKIVSGILWQRLSAGMALQVDSSLKYVIGKKDSPALTYEELRIDSPYNTYKYKGLPPTPICNPGESAIRAAIYPKNSDFWYYLSTEEGETIFAKTGAEHEANVDKYLR